MLVRLHYQEAEEIWVNRSPHPPPRTVLNSSISSWTVRGNGNMNISLGCLQQGSVRFPVAFQRGHKLKPLSSVVLSGSWGHFFGIV